jgi:iron complex transport system ATP-binding protein
VQKDKGNASRKNYKCSIYKMIRLIDLVAGYPVQGGKNPVITIDSLSAPAGELVAIIGLNGIGKSTIMKTMAGLLLPIAGQVLYDGKPVTSFNRMDLARSVTFVGAGGHLDDQFTVTELVSLGRHPHTNWLGSLTKRDHQIVDHAISAVGLEHLAAKPVRKISDGERQRAHIARALAQDTPIILLDEPTAYLDVVNRYSITWLLKDLCEKEGRTILFSTHDWNVALHAAHKIWLLLPEKSREGAPEDLALNGHFNDLMRNSALSFDVLSGRITSNQKYRGRISLRLEGADLKWAEHTMERIGYEVIRDASPVLRKSMDGNWILEYPGEQNQDFESLYNLAGYLKNKEQV